MTLFSEPKHQPIVPDRCDRCRARPAATPLFLVRASDAPAGGASILWLCDACRAIAQRGAMEN